MKKHIDTALQCLQTAWPGTWKSAKWLLRLMIPISLGVTLLQYSGLLEWMAGYLNPLFEYLGLPGASAVVFISGATAGTYAGVAALMSIPLTLRQATILGIMMALCHALPMECTVNSKTGSSFWKMGVIRLVAAFLCALLLNGLLPELNEPFMYLGADPDSSLQEVLVTWVFSQLKMVAMVFLIIYSLMVLQRIIEAYGWLRPLSDFLSPLMTVFGLPRKSAYMWLVGNVLGISYGAAVMLELQEKKLITARESNEVNYHLIMSHSLLEDTIVFAATGISAALIIASRVLFAMAVVWSRKLLLKLVGCLRS